MKTLFQSLRWRLQAWHGLLLAIVIIGFTVPTYHFARESQTQRIDRDLGRMERSLIRSLMDALQGFQPDPARPDYRQDRPYLPFADFVQRLTTQQPPPQVPPATAAQFQGTDPGYAYYSIRDRHDKILLQSANAPADLHFAPMPKEDMVEEARSIAHRRETARSNALGLKVVVGRDITPDLQEMQGLASLHLLIGFGVWLVGLLGGWWLSGRAIRPIRIISDTASRIAVGNLEERIPVTEAGELGQLSRVLNDTFQRLHASFERQRQFTADASHELRTPLTILLSETQRILKRDRTPEEYREALQTCGHTAQRMRRLVEALLLLARQENQSTAGTPARSGKSVAGIPACKETSALPTCDLATVLQDVATHLQPLAAERQRTITAQLTPTPCQAEPESITILATNLIANALQHGGNVTITCHPQGTHAVLIVKDDGPGIAETDLPHIFERFYRADQARTSTSGHTGLGLAITKAVIDNHGGSIRVSSRVGEGANFEVRLGGA